MPDSEICSFQLFSLCSDIQHFQTTFSGAREEKKVFISTNSYNVDQVQLIFCDMFVIIRRFQLVLILFFFVQEKSYKQILFSLLLRNVLVWGMLQNLTLINTFPFEFNRCCYLILFAPNKSLTDFDINFNFLFPTES